MKIHCIQHEAFEDIGCIYDWIHERNHEINYTYIYQNQELPKKLDFDFLIIMGGSASVYETSEYPWIIKEVELIKNAMNASKKILGICLGSQLIARSLGAEVFAASQQEIGWFKIEFNKTDLKNLSFLPDNITTFHWHGDTYNLPSGAIRLASSNFTKEQGFLYGKNTMALQFHPEMTYKSIDEIVQGIGSNLPSAGGSVQSITQINQGKELIQVNSKLMFDLLDFLTGDIDDSILL